MKKNEVRNLLNEILLENGIGEDVKEIFYVFLESEHGDMRIESEDWMSKDEWIEEELEFWSDEEVENDEEFFREDEDFKMLGGLEYGKYDEKSLIEYEVEMSDVVKELGLKGKVIMVFEYCMGLIYIK